MHGVESNWRTQREKDAPVTVPFDKHKNSPESHVASECERPPRRPRMNAKSSPGNPQLQGTVDARNPQMKRSEVPDDGDMIMDGDGESKRQRTKCLNLAGSDFEQSSGDGRLKAYGGAEPVFVVRSDNVEQSVRQRIWTLQAEHMI